MKCDFRSAEVHDRCFQSAKAGAIIEVFEFNLFITIVNHLFLNRIKILNIQDLGR